MIDDCARARKQDRYRYNKYLFTHGGILRSGIIECSRGARRAFYPLRRLFRMTSLCTLRTKLTRNLDAWPAHGGEKICILCSYDVLLPKGPCAGTGEHVWEPRDRLVIAGFDL